VTRSLVIIGAVAVAVTFSTAKSSAHPVGGAFTPVYRPAPVFVPPSSPQRLDRETFKVPLVNVHSPSFPEARYPSIGPWRTHVLRPGLEWYPTSPVCFANGTGWVQPGVQATWSDELASPGFTIGSLAGDPSRSLFGSSPSYETGLTSSTDGVGMGSSPISFQYGLQPALCSGSNVAGF